MVSGCDRDHVRKAVCGDTDLSQQLLATAITIHTVEARHAAALSVAAKQNPTPDGPFATPQTAFNVITALQPNLA